MRSMQREVRLDESRVNNVYAMHMIIPRGQVIKQKHLTLLAKVASVCARSTHAKLQRTIPPHKNEEWIEHWLRVKYYFERIAKKNDDR